MAGGFGLIGKGGGAIANVDQNLQIWGLYHLIGTTVSVKLLGLDLGDFVVATDGSVTVSLVDTVNQTASWTAAELIAASADYGENTVPISVKNGGAAVQVNTDAVIGPPFVSQGQRLRASAADDTKTPTGPALGMTRRAHRFSMLFQNAVAVKVGSLLTPTPSGDMVAITFTDAAGTALADGTAYSGVWESTVVDDYSFDGMLCWQIDRPYPCTVVAATSFIETEER